jgi:cell wall-associated NlpC family hydrolase
VCPGAHTRAVVAVTPKTNRTERAPAVRTACAVAIVLGLAAVGPAASGLPPATALGAAAGAAGERPFIGPVLSTGALPLGATTTLVTAADDDAPLEPAEFTTGLPDDRARIAINTAMAQIGLPYVWGGDGPTAGDAGFDCSGLTTFSYAAAGIRLPRTAHTQYYAGPHVPAGAPLQPGDLVFYGTPGKVHHVGMYIGVGRMVNAPTFGEPVQTAYYRWRGDDYLGATRPAATGQLITGLLPSLPPPPAAAPSGPVAPPVFEAPPAPLPATPLPAPTDPQPPESDTAAAAVAASDGPARTVDAGDPAVFVVPPAPPVGAAEGTADPSVVTPSPAGTTPPTTTPPTTTLPPTTDPTTDPPPTTNPETTPPATTNPTTAPPATTPPVAATPPPTTSPAGVATPATTSSPPVPTPPAAPARTAITIAGTTAQLSQVRAGADGLPRAVGLWSRPGRPVVRLGSAALVTGAGASVDLTLPGAADSRRYAVRSTAELTTAEAARLIADAPAGRLVVVAPVGEGRWAVLTAS